MTDENVLRAQGRGIVQALRLLGDVTKHPVSMDTKESRIRVQKLVYLLKVGRYAPAQKFDFNLYQNGPYSPGLTQIYYLYGNDGIATASPATDLPRELVETLKEADSKGVEFLEALATALDTSASIAREHGVAHDLARGLAWAQSIKPQIKDATWREVRAFLRLHPDLAGITSTRAT